MSEITSGAQASRRRTRKSIAHLPSSSTDSNLLESVNKENEGSEDANAKALSESNVNPAVKKTRSKSLGPGGVDALQTTSGNRRKSSNIVAPKSILKPSIPLSPLKEIPSRKPNSVDVPPSPASSSNHDAAENSPAKLKTISQTPSKPVNGISGGASDQTEGVIERSPKRSQSMGPPKLSRSPSANTLHEQEDADPEREARRKRREEIEKQRDIRRKSMANRRVSFAPEATLHTWDVVEYMQESTSSSTSTSSTKRNSTQARSQRSTSNDSRPATPPAQRKSLSISESPEHQRAAHQKKRRRSSAVPPMNFNDPETLSSSPYSESSTLGDEDSIHSHQSLDTGDDSITGSSSSSQEADVDYETTENDVDSADNAINTNTQLDASLEEAARYAGTKGIEFDENGDVSMEIVGDEITAAFKPWVKQSVGMGSPHPRRAMPASHSQENINPFSPAFGARAARKDNVGPSTPKAADEYMSMEMTRAIGGIVQHDTIQRSPNRRPDISERKEPLVVDKGGEATMEFTKALGNIKGASPAQLNGRDADEEMSMELTAVLGTVQRTKPEDEHKNVVDIHAKEMNNGTQGDDTEMDMTRAIGGILSTQRGSHSINDSPGQTDMDLTKAIGGIVSSKNAYTRDSSTSPMRPTIASRARQSTATSATGSPSLSASRPRSKNGAAKMMASPTVRPKTPTEQLTPPVVRPTTPEKTPLSANISMRKTSPKRLFGSETKKDRKSPNTAPKLFDGNQKGDGQPTPRFVLEPGNRHSRRFSDMMSIQPETQSPKMTALLDRRRSIGDQADVFAPMSADSRAVRFEDPAIMEQEVMKEQEQDLQREKPQHIIEDEVNDDRDVTTTLKEMMKSMTPKKDKLKGRKSLAVGTAKGLLGKRPAELDNDEDDGSPRNYGKASSPVKRIRLQGPSPASRSINDLRSTLKEVAGNARTTTPSTAFTSEPQTASSPKNQGRFKDTDVLASARKPLPVFGDQAPKNDEALGVDDKISLQDFLNLTNMRFMDLTMTKRRHKTAGPFDVRQGEETRAAVDATVDPKQFFIDASVAGASTLPMLELHQHSCRELKKYMAEGRDVIHDIEMEIAEENPSIFRDYTSATPNGRADLDCQLKNLKTHARLVSKGTWYEWRLKLLGGLSQSLRETENGLIGDEELLTAQEEALDSFLPTAIEELEHMDRRVEELRKRERDFASSDPEELKEARQQLLSTEEAIELRTLELEESRRRTQEIDDAITAAETRKSTYHTEIQEAYRQREQCRGWSVEEVRNIRAKVDALESQSGWSIASASGTNITLSYLHEVQLFFDMAVFNTFAHTPNAPISLTYTGDDESRQKRSQPLSTSSRFFLQLLRAQLHALTQHSTNPRELLALVSNGWNRARAVQAEIKRLNMLAGITEAHIVGDEKLIIETAVLLQEVKTKVSIIWKIDARVHGWDIKLRAQAGAKVIYGEGFREEKIKEFLTGKTASSDASIGSGCWADAEVALRKGLLSSKKARRLAY